ncbi:MAG: hypothetical protein ABMA01_24405 [Chthoniobacteraceae bacterium]
MNPTNQIEEAPQGVSPQPPAVNPRPGQPADPREIRNLALGVGLLVLAAIAYWLGLYLAGHSGTRALVASFGTFGLLWLLFKSRVMLQRHGVLVATGAIALFAVAIPFVERAARKVDHLARTRLGGAPVAGSESAPAAQPATVIAAQPAIPEPPPAPPAEEVVRELVVPPPDSSAGKLIRLKEDAKVVIGGRKFLIRAGNEFPFRKLADGMVTFVAGDEELTLDSQLVTFTGQSQETPAEITKLAMDELKKRYPGIFQKDAPQNEIFVGRTKELQLELPDFFKNPRWPLELGEQLAAQEGWKRADQPEEDAPPNAAPQPANPPPQDTPAQEAPPTVPR